MSLELLQLKFTDEESRKILTTIATSARRGADLVKQVLAFSRGIQGERVSVQMRHVVRELQGIVRQTFPKTITLQLEMAADLWTVPGHATQLHQVLMNLCVNARDAMPEGGKLGIRAANLILDREFAAMNPEASPGPHILLTVTDTGTGIPPEVRRRIFEPFFTTKEQGKGTGLGLATVLGIVKNHGGFVTVESEVGNGTQFGVYLPAERTAAIQAVTAAPEPLPTGQGELILVVDDELAIQRITQETLRLCGYRVLTAGDGAEAVALAAQHAQELRLLITDMMMPVMDGQMTARVARRLVPKVRIIGASGLVSEADETEPQKLGVDVFLRKPFTAEILVRTVAAVLDAK